MSGVAVPKGASSMFPRKTAPAQKPIDATRVAMALRGLLAGGLVLPIAACAPPNLRDGTQAAGDGGGTTRAAAAGTQTAGDRDAQTGDAATATTDGSGVLGAWVSSANYPLA